MLNMDPLSTQLSFIFSRLEPVPSSGILGHVMYVSKMMNFSEAYKLCGIVRPSREFQNPGIFHISSREFSKLRKG